MVIHTNYKTLAFTRPGYKAWIDIKCDSRNFYDITFYEDKFYAINNHNDVFVCHIEDDIAFTERIAIYISILLNHWGIFCWFHAYKAALIIRTMNSLTMALKMKMSLKMKILM